MKHSRDPTGRRHGERSGSRGERSGSLLDYQKGKEAIEKLFNQNPEKWIKKGYESADEVIDSLKLVDIMDMGRWKW